MKNWIQTLAGVLLCVSVWAQDNCRPFVPMNVGSTWELTNYNAKGKETGRIAYSLTDRKETGSGVTFVISSVYFDKDDEQTYSNSFEAYCEDGIFKYDMSFMMDGQQMQAFESFEVTVDATEFPLPDLDAPAGSTLPDGSLHIRAETDSPVVMQMTLNITDRKVEAREEMTCPAGTFDCIVLSQTASMKMVMKIETSSKDWYAEGVGVVRSESYNKKGKLQGYSLLTKYEPS